MEPIKQTAVKQVYPMRKPPMKPWKIATIIVIILAVIAAGVVAYLRYFKKEGLLDNILPGVGDKTTQVVNKLDGTKADSTLAKRHPLAIMIENHPDARPQVGLDKASIIYEAISEGGITRFMGIYGPRDANKVGPVRSARTYFVDWASEFDAFLSHVGGNLDALEKIKTEGILDLDQFGLGDAAYWREPAAGIAIEHTMFTDTTKLYAAAKAKGWPTAGDFEALSFKEPKTETDQNLTQRVSVDFSEAQYRVVWEYDAESNTYLRSMGGYAHRDRATGDRLAASNIMVQAVERWEAPTTINEQGWAMQTIGTGNAKVFMEGKMIEGTWKKTSRTSRTLFYDTGGKEIKFIPGQFWVEIVPPDVFGKVGVE